MAEPSKTQVAARVRARRAHLQLTQEELARELGVTHQHISRIEGGHAVPSLELLVKLARALGVTTDCLLTGDKTIVIDPAGAIRGDQGLSPASKRHLIGLINELHGTR